MIRIRLIGVLSLAFVPAAGLAQLAKKHVGEYNSSKEYCFDHPKSPICAAGHEVPGVKKTASPASMPAVTVSPRSPNRVRPSLPTSHASASRSSGPLTVILNQTDWRFAHPYPDILMSINVDAFLQSPVIASMLERMAAKAPVHGKSGLEKLKRTLGTIDRISVSVQQQGSKADGIVLLTGSFDEQAVPGLFHDKDGDIARVAGLNSVLLGQEPAVDGALRRMAITTQSGAPMADGLEQCDIWMSGSPRLLFPASQGIKSFSFGMNLRDPMLVAFHVTASTTAAADQVTVAFQKAEAQAAKNPATGQSVRVERSGVHVWLKVSAPASGMPADLPGGSLDKRMEPLFALLDQLPAPAATAPPAPPKKVMIYGLDDGPKEVGKPR